MPNYSSFRAKVRPTKYHWQGGKAPLLYSIPFLERVLYQIGGQPECNHLLEYDLQEQIKLTFDVEWYSDEFHTKEFAFARVKSEVIDPVNEFLLSKTNRSFDLSELVIEEACRPVDERFKHSFHLIWPTVCVTARLIFFLIEHLKLPPICDPAPWQGKSAQCMGQF